jgi:hypothetical protein
VIRKGSEINQPSVLLLPTRKGRKARVCFCCFAFAKEQKQEVASLTNDDNKKTRNDRPFTLPSKTLYIISFTNCTHKTATYLARI